MVNYLNTEVQSEYILSFSIVILLYCITEVHTGTGTVRNSSKSSKTLA
jgi:hypothetical protein